MVPATLSPTTMHLTCVSGTPLPLGMPACIPCAKDNRSSLSLINRSVSCLLLALPAFMFATFFRFFCACTIFAAVAAFVLVLMCAPKHENSFYQVEGQGMGSAKIAKGAQWVTDCEKFLRAFARSATTRADKELQLIVQKWAQLTCSSLLTALPPLSSASALLGAPARSAGTEHCMLESNAMQALQWMSATRFSRDFFPRACYFSIVALVVRVMHLVGSYP